MNDKKYLKLKECSEKKLKQIQGGNKSVIKGNPASNLAQCVFSFFKKC
ncbi:EntF family bacteriocin induction factor [Carnobacterium maltaromaticum]|uniref:Piscicolin 126 induction factor n=1 Tax=Carnobacterium maltaromaticum TaxID=2751 RepID=Q934J1_CARML|nr:EntF family bacteriocin induction factor [Carnobacterium maltaromaticum]AAK69420.1 piscicolin 126 induction factor PisN precursor [Carnobacterium maltaromaticum]AAX21355.1 piscicolin 126 induction factor [Carnobacterium maltaromaticum]MBC9808348.1 EntF family bacteriocin induction factor [Carnobacterium maltaromaticum]MCC4313161.1 enterocin induction factor [Carnobacterium maltaromaticum]MDW5523329.1 EntF family bacteriocin induction factor [Carnobacterium maltaromaticum]